MQRDPGHPVANVQGGSFLRVLVVPEIDLPPTTERTPEIYRRLGKSDTLSGVRGRWDQTFQDVRRPAIERIPFYVMNQVQLVLDGLRVGRKASVDLILCETPHHAIAGLVVAKILNVPCVWDSHGNVMLYSRSVGKSKAYVFVFGRLERILGKGVDALITVTRADADAYISMGVPSAKVHVFPTPLDIAEITRQTAEVRKREGTRRPESSDPPVLMFFGSFQYGPNRDALRVVNEVIAPSLAAEGIRCVIHIAGRDIPAWDYHPSIKILGFVPDLYRRIAEADLGIVPVWAGVGILVKALDFMAVGTPMVAARFVTQGIPEIRDGVHALLADTQESFVRKTIEALRNPEAMQAMAKRARDLVADSYDWSTQWKTFQNILATASEMHRRGARSSAHSIQGPP